MGKPPKRRVCVATGTRSEYGILRPLMRAIRKSATLQLQIVAAGMHLSDEFGRTVEFMKADGLAPDARVEMLPKSDTAGAMAEAVGRGVVGFTRAFRRLRSDIVVVLGDRIEAFAAGTAATLSGKVLAHIHGGDTSEGGYDDYMRHAITKLAHIHFAATKGSARRIERLGERRGSGRNRTIVVVGAPGLDEIRTTKLPSPAATKRRHGFDPRKPLILCVQHSISTEPENAARDMGETLAALAGLALPTVVVYPNSDAGGRGIIKVIKSYEGKRGIMPAGVPPGGRRRRWLVAYKSLPREEFMAAMKAAAVMVGNSSSGIIEAAAYGLPVVNVGRRQAGRERAGNTVDVAPRRGEIARAITRILSDSRFRRKLSTARNVYGDGRACERMVRVLEQIDTGPDLRRKQITY